MSETGFYDQRDDLVGGTDTQWSPNWDGEDGRSTTADLRADDNNRFSGVLSQSDLAS